MGVDPADLKTTADNGSEGGFQSAHKAPPSPNGTPERNDKQRPAPLGTEHKQTETPRDGRRADPNNERDDQKAPPVDPPRPAADHFGIFIAREGKKEHDPSGSGPNRGGTFRDDHKARRAVIQYETHCGRRAEAMDDLQPGFDVRSTDDATGHKRLIEVKGVQGTFEDDASVVLTARQAHDAVTHDEDGVEYWLYVVDSTETDHPRVFPIPWVRRPARLRYGFYAKVWANAAERPAVVTEEGLTDLSSKPRRQ